MSSSGLMMRTVIFVLSGAVLVTSSLAQDAAVELRANRSRGALIPDAFNDFGRIPLIQDADSDGMPDEYEIANGLDPNDPADANLDTDGDGITNLGEFGIGTDPTAIDSDGDGSTDREELLAGTDPLDPGDFPAEPVFLQGLAVTPSSASLIINTLIGPRPLRLRVRGTLASGKTVDLSDAIRGTTYSTSDASVLTVSNGGVVAPIGAGSAVVTASNGSFTVQSTLTVTTFAPTPISAIDTPGYVNAVKVQGSLAYLAEGDLSDSFSSESAGGGLRTLDVSDPRAPRIIGSLVRPNCLDLEVMGNTAFLASARSGLDMVDVSDPTDPTLIASLEVPSSDSPDTVVAVALQGTIACIVGRASGFHVVDIGTPSQPVLRSSLDLGGELTSIAVAGGIAVATSGSQLHTLNIQDPDDPRLLATVDIASGGSLDFQSITDVILSGSMAYVAVWGQGIVPVSIGNPAQPRVHPVTTPQISAQGLDIGLGFLLAADNIFVNAVPAFGLTEPAQPNFVTAIDFSQFPGAIRSDADGTALDVEGIHAYIAVGSDGLQIAQLIEPNDFAGFAPSIQILSPVVGDTIVQGETLSVDVLAIDDVETREASVLVDGELLASSASSRVNAVLEIDPQATSVSIEARAVDFGGNVGNEGPVSFTVRPDPLTTVIGRVVLADQPLADATVSILGKTITTLPDGTFELGEIATVPRDLSISVEKDIEGLLHRGLLSRVTSVRGGVTIVGDITVAPRIQSVTIDLPENGIVVGEQVDFTVTGVPNLSDATITLDITAPTLATVGSRETTGGTVSARVTGLKPGFTNLRARYSRADESVEASIDMAVLAIEAFPDPIPALVPGVLDHGFFLAPPRSTPTNRSRSPPRRSPRERSRSSSTSRASPPSTPSPGS